MYLADDVNDCASRVLLTVRGGGLCFLFPGLFNLRGNDIPYNPFFYSYTLLTMDDIWWVHRGINVWTCIQDSFQMFPLMSPPSHILGHETWFLYKPLLLCITSCSFPSSISAPLRLFVHLDRVTDELKEYLNASCVGSLCVQLKSYDTVRDDLQKYVAQPGVKVWIGTEYTNYALYELITPEVYNNIIYLIIFTV